jgi:protein N-terminal amidase
VSLAAIGPYLEPTACGPSTQWAQKQAMDFQIAVAVGYPERDVSSPERKAYNSLVFVDKTGAVVANTRKSFLYYTDETWASEGQGFFSGELYLGPLSEKRTVTAGICMDINPYKFEAPWTAYEFANHAKSSNAEVVVISMAWITRLSAEELQGDPEQPDLDTVAYWLERLQPLTASDESGKDVYVVCANRIGSEGVNPLIGPVRYAGSSTVFKIASDGEVTFWGIMGRAEQGILMIDTEDNPKYGIGGRKPTEEP